jgi:hypothetical protein
MSRVGDLAVTYKMGSGLDNWINCTLYRRQDYRQYSNIADLNTLQFTITDALVFSLHS